MNSMMKAALHPKEKERMLSLRSLNILDSIEEREFDEITQLAAQIFEVPIALISLVDSDRQWFKSKVGIAADETSRDLAFCAHAILQDDVFTVEDTFKDKRFSDNPLVTGEPKIRFYAGAPILSPVSDLPVGTLCIIDSKPRKISDDKKMALRVLANQVKKLLELRVQIYELRANNKKLVFKNAAFENMSEGVVVQERHGKIIDFNKAALTVLGMSADQLMGKTSVDKDWQAITEDGEEFPSDEHPAMEAIRLGKAIHNINMGIYSKRRELKWLLVSSTPLFLDNEREASHSVTTFADITERKKYLNAIFHSSNMASLGEMAGGIAHEINTPLAIIGNATHQLRKIVSRVPMPSDLIYKKLDTISSTNMRISKIVRGLKTISRDSDEDSGVVVMVKDIILDAMQLCREKFTVNEVGLTYMLSEDYPVYVNPTQLSQVVINLLNNAFDAVQGVKKRWVQVHLKQDDHIVKILVIDSGSGVDEEIRLKIMQPFFTTKEVGKGSGIGLSISRSIVEKFSGSLNYEVVSGHTCFVISLPIHGEVAKGAAG